MCDEQRKQIQALVTGDTRATEEFICTWHPRIYIWIQRHSWIRPVEDVAQQVWYHLLKNRWDALLQWEGLYSDSAWHDRSLEGFLRKVTVNKMRDLERAAQRQLPFGGAPDDTLDDPDGVGADPENLAERERLAEIFDSCFGRLQDRDQVNLVKWREGYSDTEIAAELGISPNNASQRRFQALRRLRECLRNNLPEYLAHD